MNSKPKTAAQQEREAMSAAMMRTGTLYTMRVSAANIVETLQMLEKSGKGDAGDLGTIAYRLHTLSEKLAEVAAKEAPQ